MLKSLSIKARLVATMAFMGVMLVIGGAMGVIGLQTTNESLRSVYAVRVPGLAGLEGFQHGSRRFALVGVHQRRHLVRHLLLFRAVRKREIPLPGRVRRVAERFRPLQGGVVASLPARAARQDQPRAEPVVAAPQRTRIPAATAPAGDDWEEF